MKQYKLNLIVLLGLALVVTGCMKKSTEQANLQGTGFETATTEELAQLPQANNGGSANQQVGIEILPIETSPVTQGIPSLGPTNPRMTAASAKSSEVSSVNIENTSSPETGELGRHQQIQTALKNAGFYNGKIDGKIGPGSKRAIEAFQESKGLKVDGKVGPRTWAALESYLTTAATATATTD